MQIAELLDWECNQLKLHHTLVEKTFTSKKQRREKQSKQPGHCEWRRKGKRLLFNPHHPSSCPHLTPVYCLFTHSIALTHKCHSQLITLLSVSQFLPQKKYPNWILCQCGSPSSRNASFLHPQNFFQDISLIFLRRLSLLNSVKLTFF